MSEKSRPDPPDWVIKVGGSLGRAPRPAPPPDGDPGRGCSATLARRGARRRELRRRGAPRRPPLRARRLGRPLDGHPGHGPVRPSPRAARARRGARRGAAASSPPAGSTCWRRQPGSGAPIPSPTPGTSPRTRSRPGSPAPCGVRRLMLVKHEDGFIGPDRGPRRMLRARAADRARRVRGRGGPVLRPGPRPRPSGAGSFVDTCRTGSRA